jgi:hypothetical protein
MDHRALAVVKLQGSSVSVEPVKNDNVLQK